MNAEEKQLKTLSDRLNYVLKITGTKKVDLARAIDVKPQIIQFLCNSNTKTSRFSFEIATALGLNTRWLATGEGTTFIADDPKNQITSNCKKIKILNNEHLLQLAEGHKINLSSIEQWEILKTNKDDIYCTTMFDTSMEPLIHQNSKLFFYFDTNYNPTPGNIVIAYIKSTNAILIRKFTKNKEGLTVAPENTDLFKSISLNKGVTIFGLVFDVYWHIRSN